MVPTRLARRRRRSESGRIVYGRFRIGAAVINELEVRQLVFVKMRMGLVSSIGCRDTAIVDLRRHMKGVIGRLLQQLLFSDGVESSKSLIARS